MKASQYSVKISAGKIEIDKPLEIGQDITIKVDGNIAKTEDSDLQDGTVERTYIIKGIICEEI